MRSPVLLFRRMAAVEAFCGGGDVGGVEGESHGRVWRGMVNEQGAGRDRVWGRAMTQGVGEQGRRKLRSGPYDLTLFQIEAARLLRSGVGDLSKRLLDCLLGRYTCGVSSGGTVWSHSHTCRAVRCCCETHLLSVLRAWRSSAGRAAELGVNRWTVDICLVEVLGKRVSAA